MAGGCIAHPPPLSMKGARHSGNGPMLPFSASPSVESDSYRQISHCVPAHTAVEKLAALARAL